MFRFKSENMGLFNFKYIIITGIFICLNINLFAQRNKLSAPIPAAHLTSKYIDYLKNKRVALVVNQSSTIKNVHLVDSLQRLNINLKKIFCPEHGFRGNEDAGASVSNSIDSSTKLPIISLYGKNKKPNASDLKDIDIVVFDLQDVGVRFYTYLSTLHYVMEACAENKVRLLVLDRPNPNGYYIDGPVMQAENTSFVGLHPVPIVYGMTIAEYAKMINGEGWLKNGLKCYLQIVKNAEYTHASKYTLPIKPSPNLIDQDAITLYPSLCLFEGTVISVGRGTYQPFKVFGHPKLYMYSYQFTPQSIPGMSLDPPYKNETCFGVNLNEYVNDSTQSLGKIHLDWLMDAYKNYPEKDKFFNPFFEKLVGNKLLKQQIIEGKSETEIRESWSKDLEDFKLIRAKYLLYK